MPRSLLAVVFILLVLHQDNWFWADETLVFGFMPIGLFYHACISVAAGATWLWAVKFCWPAELEKDTKGEPSA
ncbi:MAG: DUF3311 domain-containing protein [Planctomycetes bacterium]|nr:DUF3311 domain-containing protein [Planctomycetota bacterium]